MSVSAPASRACALAFGLAAALPARSQCQAAALPADCQDWKAGFVRPESFNVVEALAAVDLGSGPALYACGAFTGADGRAVQTVAQWNGMRWSTFASGMNDSVLALAVFDDGSGPAIYAGGLFTTAGDADANHVAKWDGHDWSTVGGGTDGDVLALFVHDDGFGPALYAGGRFTVAGGVSANRVARWDGANWSPLASGISGTWGVPDVRTLAAYDDGSGTALYAGGNFTTAGGTSALRVAKWDGASWSPLGAGIDTLSFDTWVADLAVLDDGSGSALYAAGSFDSAGGTSANRVARWNGASWSALGNGMDRAIHRLLAFDDGSGRALYASGTFATAGDANASAIARWNGVSWSTLGAGLTRGASLAAFDDGSGSALFAGGAFALADGNEWTSLARWSGSSWAKLDQGGGGTDAAIRAMTTYDAGSGPALYAGGDFGNAGGASASSIAAWDGVRWRPLAGGVGGTNAAVHALAVFDDGLGSALYAGGDFESAGGVIANRIARWDGASWSTLASGVDGTVRAMRAFDDGSGPALYVGGDFTDAGGVGAHRIARWDGASWSALDIGMDAPVWALAVFDDGSGSKLYAAGAFTGAGGDSANRIARWDGTSWTSLGRGLDRTVHALCVYDDGSGPALYAGGEFATAGIASANGIARWDGTRWSPLEGGMNAQVRALATFTDRSGRALYAAGDFSMAGGVSANRVARWDGGEWSALRSGLVGEEWTNYAAIAYALAVFDDGADGAADLFVGGFFARSGDAETSHVAQWLGCAPGSPYCAGDGIDATVTAECPCQNFGAEGRGCANSDDALGGARLAASGSAHPNSIVLTCTGVPDGNLCAFLSGTASNSRGIVFGDGVKCAMGTVQPFGQSIAGQGAQPPHTVRARPATVAAGHTRYYQVIYRNPGAKTCSSARVNISNGYVVQW